jgi:hypothetical protein
MNKFASLLIAAMLASFSIGSFAMSHGGAPKDCKKDDTREECKKMNDKK